MPTLLRPYGVEPCEDLIGQIEIMLGNSSMPFKDVIISKMVFQ